MFRRFFFKRDMEFLVRNTAYEMLRKWQLQLNKVEINPDRALMAGVIIREMKRRLEADPRAFQVEASELCGAIPQRVENVLGVKVHGL